MAARRLLIRLCIGSAAGYAGYVSFVYMRTQFEIQRRKEIYDSLISQGLLDTKVRLLDPRFLSMKILGRYENPFTEYRPQTLFEFMVMRFMELTEHGKRGGLPSDPEVLKKLLPSVKPDLDLISQIRSGVDKIPAFPKLPPVDRRLSYTWLGQSCGFLQIGKLSFLVDPLFSDHLVNRYVGPKRYIPVPVGLDRFLQGIGGPPEFVMVSHDHPDHLDQESIAKIGNKSKWIVPLGLGKYLKKRGVWNYLEMDWWDRIPLDAALPDDGMPSKRGNHCKKKHTYEVVCLPSMHWGGRILIDSNSRLWCSFMILRDGKALFYHGGDTGYASELFRRVGKEFGPVKLSALPIGQYCPEWHQRPRHISPQESVQIMKDLHSHKMVGVHWGTFVLSSENFLDPARELTLLAHKENRPNSIIIPQCGRTIVMDAEKIDFKHDDKAVQKDTVTVYQ